MIPYVLITFMTYMHSASWTITRFDSQQECETAKAAIVAEVDNSSWISDLKRPSLLKCAPLKGKHG